MMIPSCCTQGLPLPEQAGEGGDLPARWQAMEVSSTWSIEAQSTVI